MCSTSSAVVAEAPHWVATDGTHAVAADRTHAVARDGSHVVAADKHVRACASAASRRARRQGQGLPHTAPRVPHAGREKKTTKVQHALPQLSRSPLEY